MTFSVLPTYADKQIVFVVVAFDLSDLGSFDFAVVVSVRAFVMAVGKVGGETAVFISQTGGILLLAGFFMFIFIIRIAVVARRVGCIKLEPAERRAVVTYGCGTHTGAGVDAQTHRIGFVQPRVDGIHLVEHIVHIADADLTECAFQADEGIAVAETLAVGFTQNGSTLFNLPDGFKVV